MRPNGVEKQVRPSGWVPWANTIAYYKFEDNLNDSSGKWHNATMYSWSMSYTTWRVGKWYNVSSNWVNTGVSATFFWSPFTIMFWIKFNSIWSVMRLCGWYSSGNFDPRYVDWANIQYESWQGWLQFYNYSGQRTSWTWSPTAWNWYHIAIVWWGVANDLAAYINGTQANRIRTNYDYSTYNNNIWIWFNASSYWVGTFSWVIDEFVLEDKARTAQEISDYYNSIQ